MISRTGTTTTSDLRIVKGAGSSPNPDTCTCPMSLRERGTHSVACPAGKRIAALRRSAGVNR